MSEAALRETKDNLSAYIVDGANKVLVKYTFSK